MGIIIVVLGLEKHNLSNFLLQYEKVVLMDDPA